MRSAGLLASTTLAIENTRFDDAPDTGSRCVRTLTSSKPNSDSQSEMRVAVSQLQDQGALFAAPYSAQSANRTNWGETAQYDEPFGSQHTMQLAQNFMRLRMEFE